MRRSALWYSTLLAMVSSYGRGRMRLGEIPVLSVINRDSSPQLDSRQAAQRDTVPGMLSATAAPGRVAAASFATASGGAAPCGGWRSGAARSLPGGRSTMGARDSSPGDRASRRRSRSRPTAGSARPAQARAVDRLQRPAQARAVDRLHAHPLLQNRIGPVPRQCRRTRRAPCRSAPCVPTPAPRGSPRGTPAPAGWRTPARAA